MYPTRARTLSMNATVLGVLATGLGTLAGPTVAATIAAVVLLIAAILLPAVWSRHRYRRAAALELLRVLRGHTSERSARSSQGHDR